MLLEHKGKRPHIHESAYIAPTATVCGDVTIGAESCVLFGAVLVAEGGPVAIGEHCVVMEQAVLRGTARHPVRVGNHVLVGTGNDLDEPGVLQAFDPETGAVQWKFYSVPMKKGDPGLETWANLDAARHGGGNGRSAFTEVDTLPARGSSRRAPRRRGADPRRA